MKTRTLGGNLPVSAPGYGCMGLTGVYRTPTGRQHAIEIMRAAFDGGVAFFDAEAYGPFINEELIGEAAASISSISTAWIPGTTKPHRLTKTSAGSI